MVKKNQRTFAFDMPTGLGCSSRIMSCARVGIIAHWFCLLFYITRLGCIAHNLACLLRSNIILYYLLEYNISICILVHCLIERGWLLVGEHDNSGHIRPGPVLHLPAAASAWYPLIAIAMVSTAASAFNTSRVRCIVLGFWNYSCLEPCDGARLANKRSRSACFF